MPKSNNFESVFVDNESTLKISNVVRTLFRLQYDTSLDPFCRSLMIHDFTSKKYLKIEENKHIRRQGRTWGGGLGRREMDGRLSSQGFDPLPTQRVPPSNYFKISIFGLPTPKFFLKRRLWRQYILILRGERAPKKTQFFWSKISRKWKFFSQKFPESGNFLVKNSRSAPFRETKLSLTFSGRSYCSIFRCP